MIVFRYLSREVMLTLSAVSAVLLVIIMSGRFIKYLAQAAQGALDPGVLFLIMGFRLPGFLELILRWVCSSAFCWPTGGCTWTVK